MKLNIFLLYTKNVSLVFLLIILTVVENSFATISDSDIDIATNLQQQVVDFKKADYYHFNANGFISKSILNLNTETFNNLKTEVPGWFELKKYFGRPDGQAADLQFVGLLATLFVGSSFFHDAEQLEKVATKDLAEIQYIPDFLSAPKEHQELLKWILIQPDRSIYPDQLLAASLEITHGDVFKALVVGWDVLQSGWRGARNGNSNIPREDYPKTKKLAFIPHVKGDLFPTWYHFWGMMTYGYYLSARSGGLMIVPETYSLLWVTLEEALGLSKRRIESAIIRAEIDFAGGYSGAQLYRQINKLKKNPEPTLANFKTQAIKPYIYPQKMSLKRALYKLRSMVKSVTRVTLKTGVSIMRQSNSQKNLECQKIYLVN